MVKKIVSLIVLMGLMPLEVLASTTVTTNCNRVPVQENYDSTKVIYLISNSTAVTNLEKKGEFYRIEVDGIEGYINRAYTAEGLKEIMEEKSNSSQNNYSSVSTITLSPNSTFVEIAALRKQYVRDNNYLYSQSGPIVPADASKVRKTDCSAYVSDVLYYYGKAKNWSAMMKIGRQSSRYFNGIGKQLKQGKTNNFFELVPSVSQAAPGDILCYNGHVEIYAGGYSGSKPKVYNCGSTSAIRSSSLITTASRSTSKLTYILRVK